MCSLMSSWFTFPVDSPSERQLKRQRHFIHVQDIFKIDGTFNNIWLSECAEALVFPCSGEGVADTELFLLWWTGLFVSKPETPWRAPSEIFNVHFGHGCFCFQAKQHGDNYSAIEPLCVHLVFQNVFLAWAICFHYLWVLFFVFIHSLSSSFCHLRCCTIDSLMLSGSVSNFHGHILAFNLKAASYAFSMRGPWQWSACTKWKRKLLSFSAHNISPRRSHFCFYGYKVLLVAVRQYKSLHKPQGSKSLKR